MTDENVDVENFWKFHNLCNSILKASEARAEKLEKEVRACLQTSQELQHCLQTLSEVIHKETVSTIVADSDVDSQAVEGESDRTQPSAEVETQQPL